MTVTQSPVGAERGLQQKAFLSVLLGFLAEASLKSYQFCSQKTAKQNPKITCVDGNNLGGATRLSEVFSCCPGIARNTSLQPGQTVVSAPLL